MQPAIKPQAASLGLPGLRPSCSPGLVSCAGSRVRNYQKVADVCGQCGEGWHFVVTVVKKGKRYPPGGETEIGLGRQAGSCCLAILSPAEATESRLKNLPVVECLLGMWEAQESVSQQR